MALESQIPAPIPANSEALQAKAITDSVKADKSIHNGFDKAAKTGKTEVIFRAPPVAARFGMFLVGGILGIVSFAGIIFALGDLPLFLSNHGINLPL